MSRVALDPGVTSTWPPDPGADGAPERSATVRDAESGSRASERLVDLAAPELTPPKVADRYVALRPLGQGGAGAVYAAYDSELHRHVALKFIRRRVVGEPMGGPLGGAMGGHGEEWRARMMREAMAMARLSHPNVVTLYDVGVSSEDGVFLAMELVEGGTLADWIRERPRSWSQIVAMLCDAGEGLAAAHRAGMIHRDFKLDNVMLGSDGRPRVTDFGLARTAQDLDDEPRESPPPEAAPSHARGAARPVCLPSLSPTPEALAKLTLTGSIMGTPGYMAPEQYTHSVELDARADVFAFCATLYRALYGQRPFKGEGLKHIAFSTIQGEVSEPPKGSQVPAWLHEVVVAGLASDREARPASMEELLAWLRAGPAKQRRRQIATGVALALCAIGLAVPMALAHQGASPTGTDRGGALDVEPSSAAAIPAAASVAASEREATSAARPRVEGSVAASGPSPTTPADLPPSKHTSTLATPRGAGARSKGGAAVASQAASHPPRAAPPATPRCTVETSYDAEGAPHFKKVCD